jgi:transcriptional regulator with PAS, ATPase and Fis domain
LQNVIERMVHFTRTSELKREHLPAELATSPSPVEDPEDLEAPREVERRIISRMLHLEVPKNKIAQKLGVSRTTLYRKLAKYGLS